MVYPYAVSDDVFKRYPLVGTVVGVGTNMVLSADVNSIYIADAQSIIDAYLARRYILPLTAEPILTWITSDIAIYRLFEDKLPRFPDAILRRYTNAMSLLAQLQIGDLALNSSQLVTSGGDQEAWTTNSVAGNIFHQAEEITNTQSIFDPFFNLDLCSF